MSSELNPVQSIDASISSSLFNSSILSNAGNVQGHQSQDSNGAEFQGLTFVDWLEREVSTVNNQIMSSEKQLQQLALGETENLHQVMMSLEKAKVSFELLVQVRNRVLEGYQEIMRMSI